jgi:hypothetical protein
MSFAEEGEQWTFLRLAPAADSETYWMPLRLIPLD